MCGIQCRIRVVALLAVFLIDLGITARAPAALAMLHFDEVPHQPADELSVSGVTFDFKVGGIDSSEAYYNTATSLNLLYVRGAVLSAKAPGVLTLDFASPTVALRFGLALTTYQGHQPGFTVELFDESLASLGVRAVDTRSWVGFSEGVYYKDVTTPIVRAAIDVMPFSNELDGFTPPHGPQFLLDDLWFDEPPPDLIPEPSSILIVGVGMGCAGLMGGIRSLRRRRRTADGPRLLLAAFAVIAVWLPYPSAAAATYSFGTGVNQFEMEFVPIGSPGNPSDIVPGTWKPYYERFGFPWYPWETREMGAVGYNFQLGKFEVTEEIVNKVEAAGNLSLSGSNRGGDKPATLMTWSSAAKFVNWLNASSGFPAAYKFNQYGDPMLWEPGDAGFDPANRYRNSLAVFVLPNADEWHKAAYYDPVTGTYFDFPTGSNTAPASMASGTVPFTAVYNLPAGAGPADALQAGGLSPFGTMGQGGNVGEWQETQWNLLNNVAHSPHGIRGGAWSDSEVSLLASNWDYPAEYYAVGFASDKLGFRVAMLEVIPEPASLAIWGFMSFGGLLYCGWRRKSRSAWRSCSSSE